MGEFNFYFKLAAIAVGQNLVYSDQFSVIQKGRNAVKGTPGRLERVFDGQYFIAIVDLAHTPNALDKALTACRTMLQEGKRLITVFCSAGLGDSRIAD
jgi:UDP-N-acetylmuramoyl-L-alanyl-D-glutamate--2,6-diaminopimelate ligase